MSEYPGGASSVFLVGMAGFLLGGGSISLWPVGFFALLTQLASTLLNFLGSGFGNQFAAELHCLFDCLNAVASKSVRLAEGFRLFQQVKRFDAHNSEWNVVVYGC